MIEGATRLGGDLRRCLGLHHVGDDDGRLDAAAGDDLGRQLLE